MLSPREPLVFERCGMLEGATTFVTGGTVVDGTTTAHPVHARVVHAPERAAPGVGGGFFGLGDIGVFDRSHALPGGDTLEQADGTAWMGSCCVTLLGLPELPAGSDRGVQRQLRVLLHDDDVQLHAVDLVLVVDLGGRRSRIRVVRAPPPRRPEPAPKDGTDGIRAVRGGS